MVSWRKIANALTEHSSCTEKTQNFQMGKPVPIGNARKVSLSATFAYGSEAPIYQ
jgi:hypothetical protein